MMSLNEAADFHLSLKAPLIHQSNSGMSSKKQEENRSVSSWRRDWDDLDDHKVCFHTTTPQSFINWLSQECGLRSAGKNSLAVN